MPFVNIGLQVMATNAYVSAVCLLYDDSSLVSGNFNDANISGTSITITGHSFANFMEVAATAGTGALPTELQGLGPFWIDVVDANTVRLANSLANRRAGTYLTLTPGGSSTGHSLVEQGISEHSGIESIVAKELPNANGYTRQTPSPTFAIDNGSDDRVESGTFQVSFTATGGDLTHTGIATLIGGNTTIGDTTGEALTREPVSNTILAGVTQPYNLSVNALRQPITTTGSD